MKFGQRVHMEEFRAKGRMRFGTFGYYRAYEDRVRGDVDEGLDLHLQPDQVKFSFGPLEITGDHIVGPVTSRRKAWERFNLYCMYLLHPWSHPIPLANKNFGDAAVLITNGEEFIARLLKVLKAQGHGYEAHGVEYVDRGYHGRMGPFRKFNDYSYQHEWRMVLTPGTGQTLFLEIGSLEDISILTDVDDLNSNAEFREERAAG